MENVKVSLKERLASASRVCPPVKLSSAVSARYSAPPVLNQPVTTGSKIPLPATNTRIPTTANRSPRRTMKTTPVKVNTYKPPNSKSAQIAQSRSRKSSVSSSSSGRTSPPRDNSCSPIRDASSPRGQFLPPMRIARRLETSRGPCARPEGVTVESEEMGMSESDFGGSSAGVTCSASGTQTDSTSFPSLSSGSLGSLEETEEEGEKDINIVEEPVEKVPVVAAMPKLKALHLVDKMLGKDEFAAGKFKVGTGMKVARRMDQKGVSFCQGKAVYSVRRVVVSKGVQTSSSFTGSRKGTDTPVAMDVTKPIVRRTPEKPTETPQPAKLQPSTTLRLSPHSPSFPLKASKGVSSKNPTRKPINDEREPQLKASPVCTPAKRRVFIGDPLLKQKTAAATESVNATKIPDQTVIPLVAIRSTDKPSRIPARRTNVTGTNHANAVTARGRGYSNASSVSSGYISAASCMSPTPKCSGSAGPLTLRRKAAMDPIGPITPLRLITPNSPVDSTSAVRSKLTSTPRSRIPPPNIITDNRLKKNEHMQAKGVVTETIPDTARSRTVKPAVSAGPPPSPSTLSSSSSSSGRTLCRETGEKVAASGGEAPNRDAETKDEDCTKLDSGVARVRRKEVRPTSTANYVDEPDEKVAVGPNTEVESTFIGSPQVGLDAEIVRAQGLEIVTLLNAFECAKAPQVSTARADRPTGQSREQQQLSRPCALSPACARARVGAPPRRYDSLEDVVAPIDALKSSTAKSSNTPVNSDPGPTVLGSSSQAGSQAGSTPVYNPRRPVIKTPHLSTKAVADHATQLELEFLRSRKVARKGRSVLERAGARMFGGGGGGGGGGSGDGEIDRVSAHEGGVDRGREVPGGCWRKGPKALREQRVQVCGGSEHAPMEESSISLRAMAILHKIRASKEM